MVGKYFIYDDHLWVVTEKCITDSILPHTNFYIKCICGIKKGHSLPCYRCAQKDNKYAFFLRNDLLVRLVSEFSEMCETRVLEFLLKRF